MNHSLIIALIFCAAIFFGTLEQARIVLRQKTYPPKTGPLEAQRNTLRGELLALGLGIKQVQGYIDALSGQKAELVIRHCDDARVSLGKARDLHQQIGASLERSVTENSIKILPLKLDVARYHVRQARKSVEEDFTALGGNPDDLEDLDKLSDSHNDHLTTTGKFDGESFDGLSEEDAQELSDLVKAEQEKEASGKQEANAAESRHDVLSEDFEEQIKQAMALRLAIDDLSEEFAQARDGLDKHSPRAHLHAKECLIIVEQLRIARSYEDEVMRFVFSWSAGAPRSARSSSVPTFKQAAWALTAAHLTLGFVAARVLALRD